MNLWKVNFRTATKSLLQSTSLCMLLLLSVTSYAQDAANGEAVFNANCISCHSPGEKDVAAPGLAGVRERWAGNEEMLYQWIQNPNKAIATGNPYVTNLGTFIFPLLKFF